MLILDMIEVLSPLGKYKYDTWRILPVSATLTIPCACGAANETSTSISGTVVGEEANIFYLSIDYTG
jgi:hypothetical protein